MSTESVATTAPPEATSQQTSASDEARIASVLLAGKSKTAREHLSKQPQSNVAPPAVPAATATEATTQAPPAPDATTTAQDTGSFEIEGVGKINVAPKTTSTPVQVNTPDEALKALGAKYGIQGATPSELFAGMDQAWSKHRQQAQEGAKAKSDLTAIQEDFKAMPEELVAAIKTWGEGGDYKQALTAPAGVDFKKPLAQQDLKSLVNHYFPGEFTEEELADLENTTSRDVKLAVEASKDKFKTQKSSNDAAAARMIETSRERQRVFSESIDTAMTRLTEALPYFTDKSSIASLRASMESLHQLKGTELGKEFLSADGALLPDAAAKLAMLKHGMSISAQLISRASALAASKATEEVVSRGTDTPGQASGHTGNHGNQVSKEVETFRSILPKQGKTY